MAKVFKFGGASVKDALSVNNIVSILESYTHENLIVVLSAMGKMTNAFEKLSRARYLKEQNYSDHFNFICSFHYDIINELFQNTDHEVYNHVASIFENLRSELEPAKHEDYDEFYDRIVCYGELLSTTIVASYLNYKGINTSLLSAKSIIKTKKNHRNASILWEETKTQMEIACRSRSGEIILTQGFIGSTMDNKPTTLGREGSDFSASILAFLTDAEEVVIWKDVPGLLNADPKLFTDTCMIDQISYQEAIELSYYGAKIIHPKTIKPLQNKNIPLRIKSFEKPESVGSLISEQTNNDDKVPSVILKQSQLLISFSSRDYSFIAEEQLHIIFGELANLGMRINLMQNSAISFSVCVDDDPYKLNLLRERLHKEFKIRYNDGLELLTIRHYNKEVIKKHCEYILMEQRSRITIQFVMKKA
jgi:aspartate kinase